ncbi:type I-E CRISPR-associated protein Cas6/Cse3/CasE [Streptomyces pactum]|uniref:Type I-E CRISPR-associated protein Cas6/Cse3/CasE n=1 Tax=Streptomyces pactum TaxID=68249 RepID=A0A1S6J1H0_9ACTN|nr:type I-E CRISPR-associated protein Cas6/Cse3/CasE [Streptomyces pactum]AQS65598.1 type I-E CRISPR-associated protein Cas6/Cse3/CasE [Streptomyces pactum]AQS71655.1 type I-E CRISPR-associated protein Cas6/Cse3/CasE [Streptomyces pactum]
MTTAATATTVHLARITLNPRSRDFHNDLRDHTALHRRISALFPDQAGTSPRTAHNVLYRLEREPTGAKLLIQSTGITINRNALPASYTTADIDYRELNPLLDWATPGRIIRYRIDANPLKTEFVPGRRGRRVPLTGEAALTWWERKAAHAGLTPQLILDTPQPPVLATRGDKKRARLNVTRFDGIATITDTHALRQAITTGIGQGRAYGLGLLSIAPHREQ